MRGSQKWNALIGLVASTALVAGCGGTEPIPPQPTPPSPPRPVVSPYDDGVTGPADVFGPGCGVTATPATVSRRPVAEGIASDRQLSVFADAVKRTGLVNVLDHLVGATVFVPTNDAFAAYRDYLGSAQYDALMANPTRLSELLTYHVIVQRFDRDRLLAETGGVATLYGGVLRVDPAAGTITVTDGSRATSTILCGDIPTANGTVFVIDRVLATSTDEIGDHVRSAGAAVQSPPGAPRAGGPNNGQTRAAR
jgi:uncharacterized surface protein with fasciclin (FAS1) repeats